MANTQVSRRSGFESVDKFSVISNNKSLTVNRVSFVYHFIPTKAVKCHGGRLLIGL